MEKEFILPLSCSNLLELQIHIMKFAMSPKPQHHLDDIKSFSEMKKIIRLYKEHEDTCDTLLHDMYAVLNGYLDIPVFGVGEYIVKVLSRNPRIVVRCDLELYITRHLSPNEKRSHIKMLWGLMNVEDRRLFYYYVTDKKYRINQHRIYIDYYGSFFYCWAKMTDTVGDIGRKIHAHRSDSTAAASSPNIKVVRSTGQTQQPITTETLVADIWHRETMLIFK